MEKPSLATKINGLLIAHHAGTGFHFPNFSEYAKIRPVYGFTSGSAELLPKSGITWGSLVGAGYLVSVTLSCTVNGYNFDESADRKLEVIQGEKIEEYSRTHSPANIKELDSLSTYANWSPRYVGNSIAGAYRWRRTEQGREIAAALEKGEITITETVHRIPQAVDVAVLKNRVDSYPLNFGLDLAPILEDLSQYRDGGMSRFRKG